MSRRNIAVLALGGTIAMERGAQDGVVPALSAEMLVAAVPQLEEIAQIQARSFRQVPSTYLDFADLEELAHAIRELVAQGHDGVVVTQGTDTIEESAFVLDRLLEVDVPVVVTGAMRNPTVAGADGPANLLAAVQVAASSQARGHGCLVVMNDEIHAARFVRKLHTSSPSAFGSPLVGPLGQLVEGRVRMHATVTPIAPVTGTVTRSARVGLVTIALGDDASAVPALLAAGYDGLVIDAAGGGHVTPASVALVEQAAAKVPVVLASRTGAGETLAQTYGYVGGEIDLQRRGLIRAGWLDGLKARILLALLLRRAALTPAQVAAAFEPWGGGPVD